MKSNTTQAKAMSRTHVGSWVTPEAQKGLNDNLVLHIYVGNYQKTGIAEADKYQDIHNVRCLVEDLEMTVESQYSTPFQESDPQSKLPTLHAMISSGTMVDMAGLMGFGTDAEVDDSIDASSSRLLKQIESMTDKTSFSKINSMQIYGSSGSIRISGTIMLVAWDDATQVEQALRLLQAWASPTYLSTKTAMVGMAQGAQDGWGSGEGLVDSTLSAAEGALDGLYNSVVPPIVSFRYGGKSYHDFYIESVSAPLSAPMNAKGERIAIKVQISFISRKAWDRGDIEKLYK